MTAVGHQPVTAEEWVDYHRLRNFSFVSYIDPRATRTGRKQAVLGYSSSQAAELAMVPARTVHSWREKGFVVPEVGPAFRRVDVIYSLGDVFSLMAARRLLEAGIPRDVCHWIVKRLPAFTIEPDDVGSWTSYRYVADVDWWLDLPVTMSAVERLERQVVAGRVWPLCPIPEEHLLAYGDTESGPDVLFAHWVGPELEPFENEVGEVYTLFPVSRLARVLVERADDWLAKTARISRERCAPWM